MNKTLQHARHNRHSVFQRIILFLVILYLFVTLCGCTANNVDAPVSGNDGGSDISGSGEKEALPSEDKDEAHYGEKNTAFDNIGKNRDLLSAGVSLPLEESKVIDITLESEMMGRKVRCKLYFPKDYGNGESYGVWYGLHGYSSNESMWLDQVGVAAASDKMIADGMIKPVIMVFPYTRDATIKEINEDMEDDGRFSERKMDRFICEELVPYMDAVYDTAASADSRYIGGFSMGGMIALRVAFHHPDLFSKVGGYSAAVISEDYSATQLEEWLYPYDGVDGTTDVVDFSKKKGFDKLTVYLDCGTSNDPFFTGVQSLYDALQKRGIKSEFHMYNGGHDLVHANATIEDYLYFYAGKH